MASVSSSSILRKTGGASKKEDDVEYHKIKFIVNVETMGGLNSSSTIRKYPITSNSSSTPTSSFLNAMDSPKRVVDEKEQISLGIGGVDDKRTALNFKIVRGLDVTELRRLVNECIKQAVRIQNTEDEIAYYVDLVIMCYMTRDIREMGKGERDLFYHFWIILLPICPQTMISTISLITETYGSWLDIPKMVNLLVEKTKTIKNDNISIYKEAIAIMCNYYLDTLKEDSKKLKILQKGGKNIQSITLAAKWAPRQTQNTDNKKIMANVLAALLGKVIPNSPEAIYNQFIISKRVSLNSYHEMTYRKMISYLNKHIDTVQIKMCDKSGCWDTIKPGSIPAGALNKNRKAFMNQDKNENIRSNADHRIACAKNMNKHIEDMMANPKGNKKVHGANLMPHDIVRHFMKNCQNDIILEAQWIDLITKLSEEGNLGNMVPMCDVSGSMSGTPMEVSIALGLIVAELANPAFKNRILTFSSNPTWHIVNSEHNLCTKVSKLMGADWGCSTNFGAALDMILTQCVASNVPSEDVANLKLVVFSDMQFDEANCYNSYYDYSSENNTNESFSSKYNKITDAFAKAGYSTPPRIIFWNLRGDTLDFPSTGDEPGVDMVAGFSKNGLKAFMDGDITSAEPDVVSTPYDGLRKVLDHSCYDPVRKICQDVGEICSIRNKQTYFIPNNVVEEETTNMKNNNTIGEDNSESSPISNLSNILNGVEL